MHQVTVHEAKTNLSKLIRECLTGETVVIARAKTPVVQLVPVPRPRNMRQIGGAKGLIKAMADDFSAPLTDFAEYMQ